jgi:hypothetical protein
MATHDVAWQTQPNTGKGLTGIRKSAKETLPDEEESELPMQTSLLPIANKAKDRKLSLFLNLYGLICD